MPARPTIVLLNPPGRRTYLRDYYCSKVSQADYLNHPIDLVMMSGRLDAIGTLHLVDAMVDQMSPAACLNQVARLAPDVVVGLIGSVSYGEDVGFYQSLKARVPCTLVLSGDVLIDRPVDRMHEWWWADALVHDFSSPDLALWLTQGLSASTSSLTVREGAAVRTLPVRRDRHVSSDVRLPRHDLFVDKSYRYPFVRRRRFATILTDFGCPYPCNFCVMSTLEWRRRPVANVLDELRSLDRLNINELLVLDQTFGLDRSRTCELLDALRRRSPRFGWVCFTRPDVVDAPLLATMVAAGCHTVILGVESGNEDILKAARKGYNRAQIRQAFALCRRAGVRTVATTILGLPEETAETADETLAFLREVDPDYVSINVAVPRMGTPLRERALALGLIDPSCDTMDQSGHPVTMPTLKLSRAEVAALRRRAVREMYLKPGRLFTHAARLARQGGLDQLRIQLRQGAGLIRNHYLR